MGKYGLPFFAAREEYQMRRQMVRVSVFLNPVPSEKATDPLTGNAVEKVERRTGKSCVELSAGFRGIGA